MDLILVMFDPSLCSPQFVVWLRDWEFLFPRDGKMTRLNENNPLNKWTRVLEETLPDSRGQVGHYNQLFLCLYLYFQQCDVELKEFRIEADFDQRTRTARNVRVNIESYHTGATGGGFLFFEVGLDTCDMVGLNKLAVKTFMNVVRIEFNCTLPI